MGTTLKERLNEVIFGTDTPAGQRFDVVLIWLIVGSVICEILDSIPELHQQLGDLFFILEWAFTLCFTVEYGIRLWVAKNTFSYARSFYGIVDLLAIIPTYLALIYTDAAYLIVIRALRVLRIFRVLKMTRYVHEAQTLFDTFKKSMRKITVFFMTVFLLAMLFGSVLFVVEGPEHGFTSIPKSIYWAIVTITTVGYGDLVPVTVLGKFIASLVMLTGYSIIAVPTGIITANLAQELKREGSLRVCNNCHRRGHEIDASFCQFCGGELEEPYIKNE